MSTPMGTKTPIRTCVLCRQTKEKKELLRIVRTPEGDLKVDITGKMNGRGAYVCAGGVCLKTAKDLKKVTSALSVNYDPITSENLLKEINTAIRENSHRGK